MNDGGRVVPDEFLMAALKVQIMDSVYRPDVRWETRLEWAIAARSIRNRWRGARRTVGWRLSLAWEALRGAHECNP